MHTGEMERLPANLQILAASIVFSLISFAVIRGMWEINVPYLYLLTILAFQTATVLLGNRGILTSMGASSVAILLSLAAYFAAVALLFPPVRMTRIAGIAGGAVSAIFVLTSTVTSFRAGTVDLEVLDDLQIDTGEGEDLLEFDEVDEPEPYLLGLQEDPVEEGEREIIFEDPIDLTEGMETLRITGDPDRERLKTGKNTGMRAEYGGEPAAPGTDTGDTEGGGKMSAGKPPSSAQFEYRCRYRVIEAYTGNPLGIYYSDEGYSSLDPVTLGALLGEKAGSVDLRIVNLDWSNFGEVEVQVEMIVHQENASDSQAVSEDDLEEIEVLELDDQSAAEESPAREQDLPEGIIELDSPLERDSEARRYIIYERRTMRPLGEFVPEGDRPRIDRLTLYRMFPEYDFKTFQIDSIRWLEQEVGIFIKGEKKKDQE